jgi:hypothetical protein
VVLFLAAAGVSILGTMALYRGRERIAAPRTIRYRGVDAKFLGERLICQGPFFADGRAAWATCSTSIAGGKPGQSHLVRFDLEQGEARLRWPVPSKSADRILALARHRSGRIAIVLGYGEVVVEDREGRFSVAGRVPDAVLVAGLGWLGDDLEVVLWRGAGEDGIYLLSRGQWTSRPLPGIEQPPDTMVLRASAEHRPEGRVLTYVRSTGWREPDLDVVTRFPDGSETIERLRLPDRPGEAGYHIDRAAANVVESFAVAWDRTLERVGGKWQFVAPPPNGERLLQSDYVVEEGRLTWIPHDIPGVVRIRGRWLPARHHLLPIAGTTDLWAFDERGEVARVDRNLRPLETTSASALERSLALVALMAFPLAIGATFVARRARRRHI